MDDKIWKMLPDGQELKNVKNFNKGTFLHTQPIAIGNENPQYQGLYFLLTDKVELPYTSPLKKLLIINTTSDQPVLIPKF